MIFKTELILYFFDFLEIYKMKFHLIQNNTKNIKDL